MKIQFPEHEEELEAIETFLERHTFPDVKKLKKFVSQLSKIDASIDTALKKKAKTVSSYLEQQKDLVKQLAGRCHQLEVRRDVINLAEDAEKLANASPERAPEETAREAHLLRNRIDKFVKDHRPSRNNAKFIRFAKACIDKAEHGEPVMTSVKKKPELSPDSFKTKEASPETLELAELLYELACLLYQEKFGDFEEAFQGNFSSPQQKEIHYHVSNCKGSLKALNDPILRLKTVQGILGYAHDLADYYMDSTPYPTIVEIHGIFQDLDFALHEDQ